jgi:hypothetical protein
LTCINSLTFWHSQVLLEPNNLNMHSFNSASKFPWAYFIPFSPSKCVFPNGLSLS